MTSSNFSATRPRARAALARERINNLADNEIIFVDRLSPRILRVPTPPAVRLSRETLRELDKGRLCGHLGRETRFLASRMPKVVPAKQTEGSEKPPEFLDTYNERSYGYPLIRAPKRKYQETSEKPGEKLRANTKDRGKRPRRIARGSSATTYAESRVHLRGGAGEPSELRSRDIWLYTKMGRFLMKDLSWGSFVNLTHRLLRLWQGSFYCQVDLIPVTHTPSGLVLDVTETTFRFMWASSLDKSNAKINNGVVESANLIVYNDLVKHKRHDNDKWILRVRHIGVEPRKDRIEPDRGGRHYLRDSYYNKTDPWEPALGSPSLALLEIKGVGIAYWYLPMNEELHGVNQYQDTFRNAIECILPNHRKYTVRWTILKGARSSGELNLISQAPSTDLWEATRKALKSEGPVTINFEVVTHAEGWVKILVPGSGEVGRYRKISPNADIRKAYPEIFKRVRDFVRKVRPGDLPMRIWSGVQNYAHEDPPRSTVLPKSQWDLETATDLWPIVQNRQPRSMILPANPDDVVDMNIWMSEGLFWTEDAVVIRPELVLLFMFDISGLNDGDIPTEDTKCVDVEVQDCYVSLEYFRGCLQKLFEDFNPKEECVVIKQRVGHTFVISPDMTELQWRFQVFDWLDHNSIYARRRAGQCPVYPVKHIDGPLGRTSRMNTVHDDLTELDTYARATQDVEIPRPPAEVSTLPSQSPEKCKVDTIKFPADSKLLGKRNHTPAGSHRTPAPTGSNSQPGSARPQSAEDLHPKRTQSDMKDYLEQTSIRWAQEQTKNAVQEQLRLEAYSKDRSLYRSMSDPEIPMYGPSFEDRIFPGSRFPVAYSQPLTAADLAGRIVANRKLANIALERQDYCSICETTLEAGPRNLEAREQHFQDHRDALKHARNASGNFSTTAREVFYCEFCGKTTNQWERDNGPGAKHGPICAQKYFLNEVPQFCQYCGLNFWAAMLSPETVKSHVKKCADLRLMTPRGQVDLYIRFLSRSLGREQPNGEWRCHFQDCSQTFNDITTNTEKASHFWTHVNNNDAERAPCAFLDCQEDLSRYNDIEAVEHLREHVRYHISQRPPAPSQTCPFEGCDCDLASLTPEEISSHLKTHDTGFRGIMCHLCQETWVVNKPDAILEHYLTQHTSIRCQWPGCPHRYSNHATEERIEHLRTHMVNKDGLLVSQEKDAGSKPRASRGKGKTKDSIETNPSQSEDQDSIPDRLRIAYPGKNFYCPNCFLLVSGRNAVPCRRHRGGCNIVGHENWLILTEGEMKKRKAQRKATNSAVEPATKSGVKLKLVKKPLTKPVTKPTGKKATTRKPALKKGVAVSATVKPEEVKSATPAEGKKGKRQAKAKRPAEDKSQARPSKKAKKTK